MVEMANEVARDVAIHSMSIPRVSESRVSSSGVLWLQLAIGGGGKTEAGEVVGFDVAFESST